MLKISVETRKKFEIQFDRDVRALLAAGRTHAQLIQRMRQLVLAEAGLLPPRKVIYNTSYGGFGINKRFEEYLKSFTSIKSGQFGFDFARDDPVVIKAIADFGRSICDELPYILADFRTSKKWRLEELMRNPQGSGSVVDVEGGLDQHPDLVIGAKAFYDQSRSGSGRQQGANKGDFVDFARHNSDCWMQHEVLTSDISGSFEPFPVSLAFAHELLAKDPVKYRTGPDKQRDAAIYERVGVLAANTSLTKLAIAEVPALVDYKIDEYDGLENVQF